jgi:arsenate reductase
VRICTTGPIDPVAIAPGSDTTKGGVEPPHSKNMSDTITVYEKPTCTKCREMDRYLRESGVDFSKVNYYLEPLSEPKLRELIKKMEIKPRDLLRTSESIYRELEIGKKDLDDDEIIALMVKHPDLMQRPIVERGGRAVLGRPTENVKSLL